jgi:uncharacterized protein YjiS (DUF1127 family)
MTLISIPTTSLAAPFGRRGIPLLAGKIRRLINGWIASTIAYHERRAALAALRMLDDRELKDMGLHRGPLDDVIVRAARTRSSRVRQA